MPKVSIIITCYNLGAYLEEALSSALAQTYPDVEVMLIDDGSTDPATIALLERLPSHPRLGVLRTANQGVARARNYAITQASGTYILPLDGDDRLLPTYVEQGVAILDRSPEAGFVGCHYRTFGEREAYCQPASYDLPGLLVENTVPVASLFRRACWEQVGGYSAEVAIEDWDLWLSILELGCTGIVIPEVLFEYRVRANSRHGENQQAQVYQRTRALLYERHSASYQRYASHIILAQVALHSVTLEYQNWLEDQTVKLRAALEEQQQLITALQTIADARADWIAQVEAARDYYVAQSNQWQQAAEQLNPSLLTKMRHAYLYLRSFLWRLRSLYVRVRRRVSLGKRRFIRTKETTRKE
jgi:glycosyltransferase involved in cell wall biosynthesis